MLSNGADNCGKQVAFPNPEPTPDLPIATPPRGFPRFMAPLPTLLDDLAARAGHALADAGGPA